MAATQKETQQTKKLTITRIINAPQARVFKAWTDVEDMKKWTGPGDLGLGTFEFEYRVGGRYRLGMQGPDGVEYVAYGVYKVIEPPKKLVYTWKWETDPPDAPDTLVTVLFNARGKQTEVVVTHEGLKPDAIADHSEGWNGSLDKLEHMFE